MRTRLSAVLGVVVIATAAMAPSAVADAHGSRRSLTLRATSTSVGPLVQHAPACDASGQCIGSYSSANTLTGDLTGTMSVEGSVQFVAGRTTIMQTNLQLVTAQVAGCGSGSFVILLPFQPISLVAPSVSAATIVEGSGTGDLTSISGTVTEGFTPSPNGGGVGNFVLKVRCRSRS